MESPDQTGDLDPSVEIKVENVTDYYYSTFKSSSRPNNLSHYMCDVCNIFFAKLGHLKNHMLNHYEKGFTNLNYIKKHMVFHGDKRHICDMCGKSFTLLGNLRNHKCIDSCEKPYKCDFCERQFSFSNSLARHMRAHNGRGPFKCNSCGRSFTKLGNLKRHSLNHTQSCHIENKDDAQFICGICSKTFAKLSCLKTHMLFHGDKRHMCETCGKAFTLPGDLGHHKRIHSGEKPYKCVFCDRKFTFSSNLTQHMRTHNEWRPYKCKSCGQSFTKLGNLKRHSLNHTQSSHTENKDDAQFICGICSKIFTKIACLQRHMVFHGDKHHTCDTCGKSFTLPYDLRNHKRIHTGEKPYKCDFCERTFRVARTLTDHLRIHTGERPYKCESCGQSFTHLGSLKRHSLKHTKSSPIQNEDHSSHKQKKAKLYIGTSADEQFDQTVFSEVSTKRNTVTGSDTTAVANESTMQPKILYGEKTELALPNVLKNDNGIQSGENANSCKNDSTVNHSFKQTINFKTKTDKDIQSVHGLDNSLIHIDCSSLKQEVTETYNETTEQPGDTRKERVTVSKLIPISKTITPKSSSTTNKTAQFICGICSKAFAKLIYLKKHMVFHGDKSHICETCGKAFTLPDDLRHHKYIHTGEKPYKCDFFERKFRLASSLNIHWRTHTRERPYKCELCGQSFSQSQNMKKHSLKHAKSSPIQNEDHSRKSLHSKANHKQKKAKLYTGKSVDELCDQAVFSKVSTKRNTVTGSDTAAVAKKSTLQPKILYGEKTELALPNDLKNDNGIQSGEKPNSCKNDPTVNHTFKQTVNFKAKTDKGIQSVYGLDNSLIHKDCSSLKQEVTETYNETTEQPGDTRKERVTVSKLIPISKTITPKSYSVPNKTAKFICGICSKTFAKLIYLRKHMVFHGDKRHICETCGKSFTLPGDLRHHKYIHTGEKPYKCKSCGWSFAQLVNLKRHYIKHTQSSHIHDKDDAQFICGICSKTFAKLIYLKKHMVFHGDKRHICETCGKAFTLPGDLRHHKYIHTGEKPYKCDFCERKFRVACTLSAHLRTHTGERPYKCKSCALTFIQLGSLKKHSLKHAKSSNIKSPAVNQTFKQTVNFEAKSDKGTHSDNGIDNTPIAETSNDSTEQPGDIRKESVMVLRVIPQSKTITLKSSSDPNINAQFICGICSKTFAELINLKKHMFIHGDKRHTCEECGKAFILPSDLINHKRTCIHSGEGPYKCDWCERIFPYLNSLRCHMRIHRQYKCKSCGRLFTRFRDLKIHYSKSNYIQNEDHSRKSADEQCVQTQFSEANTKIKGNSTNRDTTHIAFDDNISLKLKNLIRNKPEPLPRDSSIDEGTYKGGNSEEGKRGAKVKHSVQTVTSEAKTTGITTNIKELDNTVITVYENSSSKQEVITSIESHVNANDTRTCTFPDNVAKDRSTNIGEGPYKCEFKRKPFTQRGHYKGYSLSRAKSNRIQIETKNDIRESSNEQSGQYLQGYSLLHTKSNPIPMEGKNDVSKSPEKPSDQILSGVANTCNARNADELKLKPFMRSKPEPLSSDFSIDNDTHTGEKSKDRKRRTNFKHSEQIVIPETKTTGITTNIKELDTTIITMYKNPFLKQDVITSIEPHVRADDTITCTFSNNMANDKCTQVGEGPYKCEFKRESFTQRSHFKGYSLLHAKSNHIQTEAKNDEMKSTDGQYLNFEATPNADELKLKTLNRRKTELRLLKAYKK